MASPRIPAVFAFGVFLFVLVCAVRWFETLQSKLRYHESMVKSNRRYVHGNWCCPCKAGTIFANDPHPPPLVEESGGDGIIKVRSKLRTKYPMYYVNLDKSTKKKARMEWTFGNWGNLTRVPAVEAMYDDAKAEDISRIASHLAAINEAYISRAEIALILEDNVSSALSPYWTLSLEDLVGVLKESGDSWDVVQLQVTFVNPYVYKDLEEERLPQVMRHGDSKFNTQGSYANLMSRRGMAKLRNILVTGPGGKIDCDRLQERHGIGCTLDEIYWRLREVNSHFTVPAMFAPPFNDKDCGPARAMVDFFVPGFENANGCHEALKLAVETFERHNAPFQLPPPVKLG